MRALSTKAGHSRRAHRSSHGRASRARGWSEILERGSEIRRGRDLVGQLAVMGRGRELGRSAVITLASSCAPSQFPSHSPPFAEVQSGLSRSSAPRREPLRPVDRLRREDLESVLGATLTSSNLVSSTTLREAKWPAFPLVRV